MQGRLLSSNRLHTGEYDPDDPVDADLFVNKLAENVYLLSFSHSRIHANIVVDRGRMWPSVSTIVAGLSGRNRIDREDGARRNRDQSIRRGTWRRSDVHSKPGGQLP